MLESVLESLSRNITIVALFLNQGFGKTARDLGVAKRTLSTKLRSWGYEPRQKPNFDDAQKALRDLEEWVFARRTDLGPVDGPLFSMSHEAYSVIQEAFRAEVDVCKLIREAIKEKSEVKNDRVV